MKGVGRLEMTFEVLWGGILLIGMVITAITSILTLREKAISARQPHKRHMEQVDEHERKLAADYQRLEKLEENVETLIRDGKELHTLNRIQTTAIQALLKHEIDGNDIHMLETEQAFIDRYLHPEKYEGVYCHEQI